MIDNTTKGFVEIDNELSERQVMETEQLQFASENFYQEAYDLSQNMDQLKDLIGTREITDEDIRKSSNYITKIREKEEEIEDLKLTLEKNELKEQKLKQQLTEMESIIDKMENQNITQPLSPLQEAEKFLADRKK